MPVLFSEGFLPSVAELHAEASVAIRTVERFRKEGPSPGMNIERLVASGLWSLRVNRDVRIILGQQDGNWLLLHAGHHDAAYAWADRHRTRVCSRTGALQLVSLAPVREEAQPARRARVHVAVELSEKNASPMPSMPTLDGPLAREELAYLESLGVPDDWALLLKEAPTEDVVLAMLGDLPVPARERVVALLGGDRPSPPMQADTWQQAEDTRRQFAELHEETQLAELLAGPLRQWLCFMHPTQERLARGVFSGPVKVTGAAGTGKTTLALHRAAALARAGKRVLLTTFSSELAEHLSLLTGALLHGDQPARQRVIVSTVHTQAGDICRRSSGGPVTLLPVDQARAWVTQATQGHPRAALARSEWAQVVLPQAVMTGEAYLAADRSGRRTPMNERVRRDLWPIFAQVRERMAVEGVLDMYALAALARERIAAGAINPNFDAVLADEAQDLGMPELRFLLAMAGERRQLWLLGDGAQRIYQRGFSLKDMGIAVVGRSFSLTLNYRTTERIRRFADAVLSGRPDDMEGASDTSRQRTRSLRVGEAPTCRGFPTREEELDAVVAWLGAERERGLALHEMCVVVRVDAEGMVAELGRKGVPAVWRTRDKDGLDGKVRVLTMHGAKGLEFKVVFIARCEAGSWPHSSALSGAEDESALTRELNVFHVACTRARDRLYVSWSGTKSPSLPVG